MIGMVQDALRSGVAFTCLLCALVLAARLFETTFPAEPDQPGKAFWLDYKLVAVCLVLPWCLSSVTGFTSSAVVSAFGGGLIHLRTDGGWFLPSLITYLVAYDFYRYWMHRFQHSIPWLWRIHSFHHSAERLTIITGARHHWLDSVINAGFFPGFAIACKAPPEILLIGNVITFLPDTCAHLNVRLHLGRFALWINNPQLHRIHHSLAPEHFDRNFAPVFPFWDVVFETAWRPGPNEFPATGLADGDKPHTVWDGVVWPFRRSQTSLATSGRALAQSN